MHAGKLAEHKSFLSALQTSQVHPYLDIRTAKIMSKFTADQNAQRVTQKNKRFYSLVSKTLQSSSLKENYFCKTEKENLLI